MTSTADPRGRIYGLGDLAARNAAIVQAILAGDTLEEVGARHGISRERVRQLVDRARAAGEDIPDLHARYLAAGRERVEARKAARVPLPLRHRFPKFRTKADRLWAIRVLRELAATLGRTPSGKELSAALGMHHNSVAMWFVGGSRKGDAYRRGTSRWFRLAGVARNPCGYWGSVATSGHGPYGGSAWKQRRRAQRRETLAALCALAEALNRVPTLDELAARLSVSSSTTVRCFSGRGNHIIGRARLYRLAGLPLPPTGLHAKHRAPLRGT